MSSKSFLTGCLVSLSSAVAGAAALLLAGSGLPPRPEIHAKDFIPTYQDAGLTVNESKFLELPYLFGDFDLVFSVMLTKDVNLDVVFRNVVPRMTPTGGGQFHGRFHTLRISTRKAGSAYRSSVDALFDKEPGGVLVKSNVLATVTVQGRGHRVRAYVAGKWLPWIETPDDHGGIALIPRNGQATIHDLRIPYYPRRARAPAWLWGAIAGLLGLLLVARAGSSKLFRAVAFLVLLPVGGWLGSTLLLDYLSPWTVPSLMGLLCAGLCGLPLALGACVRRGRLVWIVLGVALGAGMLELAARRERLRLEPLSHPRLSLYFGENSGTAPFDAFTRRLPTMSEVFRLDSNRPKILFLGGKSVFEAHPDMGESVGLRTAIAVGQKLDRKFDGLITSTPLSHALQQLLLFRRFYQKFEPELVVFGLTQFEDARSERMRARQWFDSVRSGETGESWSTLVELHRRADRGEQPLATPGDLRSTLDELRTLAADRFPLVFVTVPGISPPMLAVLEEFSKQHEIPLVRDVLAEDGTARVDELVEVVTELLR